MRALTGKRARLRHGPAGRRVRPQQLDGAGRQMQPDALADGEFLLHRRDQRSRQGGTIDLVNDGRSHIGEFAHRAGQFIRPIERGFAVDRPHLDVARTDPEHDRRICGPRRRHIERHRAFAYRNGDSPVVLRAVANRTRKQVLDAEEIGDIGRFGLFPDGFRRRRAGDRAEVHHDDLVGEGERLLLVVGYEDRGHAGLALDALQLEAHLGAQLGVEIGQRLVEQEHFGPDHQGAGQGHPLLLAAGKLARIAPGEVGQSDEIDRLGDARRGLAARNPAPPQAEGDVVEHRHEGEQGVVLEDDAEIAPPRRQGIDRLAADAHFPFVERREAGDQAQGRRLAAAAWAEQAGEAAGRGGEADPLHRPQIVIPFRYAGNLDVGHRPIPEPVPARNGTALRGAYFATISSWNCLSQLPSFAAILVAS